jgi:class 3 adenylate cyclase
LPERTAGLVLCDPFVSFIATPETPWMWSPEEWDRVEDDIRSAWGTPAYRQQSDFPDDREFEEWFLPWMRASVAPGALAAESDRFATVDVRSVLPTIQVPTLVVSAAPRAVNASGRIDVDIIEMTRRNAAFIAERIPGSRVIESASTNDVAWFHWYGRASAVLDAVGELVSRVREEQETFDRILATVLFTDIVNSSDRVAELGDRSWGELLERHHAIVRSILGRFRGHEVDTAGDGFFATFDGPARAVRAAQAIVEAVRPLGLDVRAGVHTGEVQTMADKVGGMAVVIGARIGALATPGEVLASSTVKDLTVGSGLVFEDAGEHELKGVPDRWHVHRAASS